MTADLIFGSAQPTSQDSAVINGRHQMVALQLRNTTVSWLALEALSLIVIASLFTLARLFLTLWSSQ